MRGQGLRSSHLTYYALPLSLPFPVPLQLPFSKIYIPTLSSPANLIPEPSLCTKWQREKNLANARSCDLKISQQVIKLNGKPSAMLSLVKSPIYLEIFRSNDQVSGRVSSRYHFECCRVLGTQRGRCRDEVVLPPPIAFPPLLLFTAYTHADISYFLLPSSGRKCLHTG